MSTDFDNKRLRHIWRQTLNRSGGPMFGMGRRIGIRPRICFERKQNPKNNLAFGLYIIRLVKVRRPLNVIVTSEKKQFFSPSASLVFFN